MADKLKTLPLKKVPKDVYDILLDKQLMFKKNCNCSYSLQRTVFAIIRQSKDIDITD